MNVLFVRGADESGATAGRDWLALELEKAHVKVSAVAAYQRTPTQLTESQKAQVQKFIADGAIWVFSSSAALQALVALNVLKPIGQWPKPRSPIPEWLT
jgi:uroporphyrinogen-III synthase